MSEKIKKTTKNSKKSIDNSEKKKVALKVRHVKKTKKIVQKTNAELTPKTRKKISNSVKKDRKIKHSENQQTVDPILEEENLEEYVEKLIKKRKVEERVEKEKILVLRAGVAFFMIIVVFVWGFNIKNTLRNIKVEKREQITLDKWGEMTKELSSQIDEMKDGLGEVSKFIDQDEDIQKLREELSKELDQENIIQENSVASTTIIESSVDYSVASTSSSTKMNELEIE